MAAHQIKDYSYLIEDYKPPNLRQKKLPEVDFVDLGPIKSGATTQKSETTSSSWTKSKTTKSYGTGSIKSADYSQLLEDYKKPSPLKVDDEIKLGYVPPRPDYKHLIEDYVPPKHGAKKPDRDLLERTRQPTPRETAHLDSSKRNVEAETKVVKPNWRRHQEEGLGKSNETKSSTSPVSAHNTVEQKNAPGKSKDYDYLIEDYKPPRKSQAPTQPEKNFDAAPSVSSAKPTWGNAPSAPETNPASTAGPAPAPSAVNKAPQPQPKAQEASSSEEEEEYDEEEVEDEEEEEEDELEEEEEEEESEYEEYEEEIVPPKPPAQAAPAASQRPVAPPVSAAPQKPLSQPAPAAPVQKPAAQPAPAAPVQKPTAQPAPAAAVQKPVAQPVPAASVHKPAAQPAPGTLTSKPASQPTAAPTHKPANQPLLPHTSPESSSAPPKAQIRDQAEPAPPPAGPSKRPRQFLAGMYFQTSSGFCMIPIWSEKSPFGSGKAAGTIEFGCTKDQENLKILLDVRGFAAKALEVRFKPSVLQVEGKYSPHARSFFKSYNLPEGTKPQDVECNLYPANGVLQINIPLTPQ